MNYRVVLLLLTLISLSTFVAASPRVVEADLSHSFSDDKTHVHRAKTSPAEILKKENSEETETATENAEPEESTSPRPKMTYKEFNKRYAQYVVNIEKRIYQFVSSKSDEQVQELFQKLAKTYPKLASKFEEASKSENVKVAFAKQFGPIVAIRALVNSAAQKMIRNVPQEKFLQVYSKTVRKIAQKNSELSKKMTDALEKAEDSRQYMIQFYTPVFRRIAGKKLMEYVNKLKAQEKTEA